LINDDEFVKAPIQEESAVEVDEVENTQGKQGLESVL